jgi:hypothetical protein
MNNEDQILMGNIQFGPELIPDEHYTNLDKYQMAAGGPRNPRPRISYGPRYPNHLDGMTAPMMPQNAPEAPCEPSGIKDDRLWPKERKGSFLDKFDVPMTFRDFLRLKKEALDAYQTYLDQLDEWESFTGMDRKHAVPWPEALKGLTREDIEILKQ